MLFNLGSINVDHVYRVPRFPGPGETLRAEQYGFGLGGKGANQSVAAMRAGASVRHVGAVGADGAWARQRLSEMGADVIHVATAATATGHAVITVDAKSENVIVIFAGANRALAVADLDLALAGGGPSDTLLMQNETTLQPEAARRARARGMEVVYVAAPFDLAAVRAVLPDVTLLIVNEVEAAQLAQGFGTAPDAPPAAWVEMVVTRGARGASWHREGLQPLVVPAVAVTAVDTTGAGDCFAGTLLAGRDRGLDRVSAMRRAAGAAALQVTRQGAAEAMPHAAEVDALLRDGAPN